MRLLLLAGLLAGCQGRDDPRYRDELELLGIGGDGAILDARAAWSNTGFLAGQGEVSCALLRRRAEPLLYRQRALPGASRADDEGVVAGADSLLRRDGGWALTVASEALSARLELAAGPAGAPAAASPWAVDAPVLRGALRGHWQAGDRGGLFDGRGLLLRRRGTGGPRFSGEEQLGLYVLGDDVSIGLVQSGPRLYAWALAADLMLPTEDLVVTRTGRGYRVDLRPAVDLVVQIKTRSRHLRSAPMDALTRPERWLLRLTRGELVRTIRAASASIRSAGAPASYPAIAVRTAWK